MKAIIRAKIHVLILGFLLIQTASFGQAPDSVQIPLSKGVDLFYNRCGACHPVIPPSVNGPHLYGIVRFYQMEYPDPSGFKKAVFQFLNDPKSNSKMTREVKQFGHMPKMNFDKAELKLITTAMWNFERAQAWTAPFAENELEGVTLNEGGKLFVIKCGACHSLKARTTNGPSAKQIVTVYSEKNKDSAIFQKKVAVFLQDPNPSNAEMKKAVKKYGSKPKMKFDDKEIDKITKWMWDTFKNTVPK